MSTKTTIRIQRFNPDKDKKPYFDEFVIEPTSDTTVLDALHMVKAEQDGSVTFRRSCRHAICGSCAMNVNGSNMLVCKTPLRSVTDKKGMVTIRPLPYLPIIKDLVVDRSSFWKQYQRVKPWLIPPDNVPEQEFRVSPEEVKALNDAETCIMCGACYSSCQVIAMNKEYIGPGRPGRLRRRLPLPHHLQLHRRLPQKPQSDSGHRNAAQTGPAPPGL
ncbi:MAG: 2Fe-2S iron-sulfur cluster-binding protein [Anaerolineae bacterium]